MRARHVGFALTVAVILGIALAGEPLVPGKPTRVTLTLKDNTRVFGMLVSLGDAEVVIDSAGKRQTVETAKVQPICLYAIRRQLADLTKAETHVALGQFCLANGLAAPAEREFAEAVVLDKSLADRIRRIKAGEPVETEPATVPTTEGATTLAAATVPATGPATAPSIQRSELTAPAEKDVVKYEPTTPAVATEHRKLSDAWGEQIAGFCKHVHLIETEHFLVYSCWTRDNDKALSDICERMYAAMCQQFDIPATENVWAGKCPIYVFWTKEDFTRFCIEVYKRGNPEAAGFCGQQGQGFVFIAMGPARTKDWFFEVLVHEATHGFLARYRTSRQPPTWVHEGVAETITTALLPKSDAARQVKDATKEAVKDGKPVLHVFEDVGLNTYDYGIAQSFVQYLIVVDRKAFIRFIQLMKEGKTDEEAMKEAYGFGKEEFARKWFAAARSGVR